jgi:hypothetical protein
MEQFMMIYQRIIVLVILENGMLEKVSNYLAKIVFL